MTRSERGIATLLLPCVFVVALALVIGTTRVGAASTARARAEAVADMVALAAVNGGSTVAATVAGANGAELVTHDRVGHTESVSVRHGGVLARSAAEPSP